MSTEAITNVPLSEDLLRGADAISEFMFGTPEKRRLVYYMFERCGLPCFKMGQIICGRKSTIMKYISERERASAA